jgi:hypothetical protein
VKSRAPSFRLPSRRSFLLLFFGTLVLCFGGYRNHQYWQLTHRGARILGTLEQVTQTRHTVYGVIPTGTDYKFTISYTDSAGGAHRFDSDIDNKLLREHTILDRFTRHPIEVLYVPDDPDMAGLPDMIDVSVYPFLFGSVMLWFSGFLEPVLIGASRVRRGVAVGWRGLATPFAKSWLAPLTYPFREIQPVHLNEEKTIWIIEQDFGATRTVRHRGREITYNIPAEVLYKATLRIEGAGKSWRQMRGALLIHVCVDRGQSVVSQLWISERQALAGGATKITVLSNTIRVNVPPTLVNGTTIRVRGQGKISAYEVGMPLRDRPRGDLLLSLNVFADKVYPMHRPVDHLSAEDLHLESWLYRRIDEITPRLGQKLNSIPHFTAERAADLYNDQGWLGIASAMVPHLGIPPRKISFDTTINLPVPGQCQTNFVNNRLQDFHITIRTDFTNDPFCAAAVLAHELCHAVEFLRLSNRQPAVKPDRRQTLEIERTVDLLVFLFGLGEFQLRVARQNRLCLGYFEQDMFERMYVIASRKVAA